MKSNLDYMDQSQNNRPGANAIYTPRYNNQPPEVVREMNWCEMAQKNKPQGNSCVLEIMLLYGGGIIFGNILFSTNHIYEPWVDLRNRDYSNLPFTFMQFSLGSFLVAAAIGGLNYHILMRFIPRKILRQIPCVLFYISGILYIAVPHNGVAVILARTIAGYATAMALVFLLIQMPEVSVVKIRGMNSSIGAIMFGSFGILIASSLGEIDVTNFQDREGKGTLSSLAFYGMQILIFTFMGQVLGFFLHYESPVYFLQKGDVCAAKLEMCRLRNETTETWEIRKDREDLQRLVDEDRTLSPGIFNEGNLRPLLLVIATRLAFVFSFNYPINVIRINLLNAKFYSIDYNNDTIFYYGAMILGFTRIFGMFGLFTVDLIGRKKMFLLSTAGTVISGLVFAGLLLTPDVVSEPTLTTIAVFGIMYELFQCLAIGSVADIFTAEAFALPKKAGSIGFAVFVEYMVQAILMFSTHFYFNEERDPENRNMTHDYFAMFLTMMVATLACTILVWLKCPETKSMTIRETRSEFRGPLFESQVITSAYA